ncbi:phosphatase domain-containing protein [Haloferula sp. BvORR071]|uniref:App1 family protein n=1 Tax=Haloferula sp. BvORR071 TaxID=1396141 RepID=UPI0006988DE0|nr:phosphatase domain-containing protein [Haloferula sp. BvORR071]
MASDENELLRWLHRSALATEETVDRARRWLWRSTGRNQPQEIAAYHGYADATAVHLTGRVLAQRAAGGPLDDDGWWDNLVNTWRRWESDEVANVPVTIGFGDQEQTVTTDEEGYYQASFPAPAGHRDELSWQSASAAVDSKEGMIQATHEILIPSPRAAFGIISDLDDTVIHTGITSLLLAAKLTFLENAKTRKPLDGVAELYQALQRGLARQPRNPLFYISSSPWNLYDLLVDFLRLNEIPAGPLMLRDLGIDETKFIKEQGHGHKREKALRLIDAYPSLPFVLLGDSGQQDPEIYAEIARSRPGRILACYIRDIDPDFDSERDTRVRRAVELAAAAGVPMVLARDSVSISEHARSLGLLPPSALPAVAQEAAADKQRPETGEQAVHDALESLLPG